MHTTDSTLHLDPHAPLSEETYAEIDAILDDLRSRYEETPQWEFCEGFMVALICCRRAIPQDEYLEVLLGTPPEGEAVGLADGNEGSFVDAVQRARFLHLWTQRWNAIAFALDHPVEDLGSDGVYEPAVLDVRAALEQLSADERSAIEEDAMPSFGQVWALGFMYAVEVWPEEWAPPRDKEVAQWLNACLDAMVELTEDDSVAPEVNPFDEEGPPTISSARLNQFADALWAVYDLREIARNLGPRVETVRKLETPGRNDLCHCGSGKKYKKCHGA